MILPLRRGLFFLLAAAAASGCQVPKPPAPTENAAAVTPQDALVSTGKPWPRKALVTGRGEPFRESGGATHAEIARQCFLQLVGNPKNDPTKGWTCEMSWDVMVKAGMNPTNTPMEDLFRYLGNHRLGYRIVINNTPNGQNAPAWDVALANGMMVFAPHYNNTPGQRFDDPIGIKSAVSVGGGGRTGNVLTFGQSLEFHDALPLGWSGNTFEDPAQSWANQQVAAKFARILDAHPEYNIWDARQHLRQSANRWQTGWTEQHGYGWVDEKVTVKSLEPGAPLSFLASASRDRHQARFSWQNFLMTDFVAAVIAKADGQIIYEGTATNFIWQTDSDGDLTFHYWSKNKAGGRSRHESCQVRNVSRLLRPERNFAALILGMPLANNSLEDQMCQQFLTVATNWNCDVVVPPGSAFFDSITNFPVGSAVGVKSNYADMVSYAIANKYRLVMVPTLPVVRMDLERYQTEWDRATAAGILVVLPHHLFREIGARTNLVKPSRLGSAVTVGPDIPGDPRSSGLGVEFLETVSTEPQENPPHDVNLCVARIGGKLASLLEAYPAYNAWDARQHLRQLSSQYPRGWEEDGGYGRPPAGAPPPSQRLEIAPPLRFTAKRSADGRSVNFTWEKFPQSDFSEVELRREGAGLIYHGTGISFDWHADINGEAEFTVQARSKTGAVSRTETYNRVKVAGLRAAQ